MSFFYVSGWVEPLLARIRDNPKTVISPTIDSIDDTTLEYFMRRAEFAHVGRLAEWSAR